MHRLIVTTSAALLLSGCGLFHRHHFHAHQIAVPSTAVCASCPAQVIKGDTGPRGPQGLQGLPGRDGRDAPPHVPEGSSVPGVPKGDRGEPGKDGKDGQDGTPGRNGQDGKDGTAGSNGKDGKDGRDGKDGQAGDPGVAGVSSVIYIPQILQPFYPSEECNRQLPISPSASASAGSSSDCKSRLTKSDYLVRLLEALGLLLTAASPFLLPFIKTYLDSKKNNDRPPVLLTAFILLAVASLVAFFAHLLTYFAVALLFFICAFILSSSVLVVATAYAYKLVAEADVKSKRGCKDEIERKPKLDERSSPTNGTNKDEY